MLAAFLITLREGLEAALIVGIVLATLRRLGRIRHIRTVWAGVLVGVLASGIAGAVLQFLGVTLEGHGEEIFEGAAMLLASAALTWMVFWMQRQGAQMAQRVESKVQVATRSENAWALFGLVFVAVVREGVETALFLTAAAFTANGTQVLIGGAVGLGAAVVVGFLIISGSSHVRLRVFFRTTSIVLILFAAGLLAHGVHELQEARLLPTVIDHVWDINPMLDETSTLGSFLKAIFGYNGNPSLLEAVIYTAYLLAVGLAVLRSSLTLRPVRHRVR